MRRLGIGRVADEGVQFLQSFSLHMGMLFDGPALSGFSLFTK